MSARPGSGGNWLAFNSAPVTVSGQQPANTVSYSIPFSDGSVKTRDRYLDHPTAHLTVELSKPLHHFNEEQLHDLIHELEEDRFIEQEETVARLTNEVYMNWKGSRTHASYHPGHPLTFAVPTSKPSFSTYPSAPVATISTKHITVVIPPSIPEEYVKPFAERMIRDQIEEG